MIDDEDDDGDCDVHDDDRKGQMLMPPMNGGFETARIMLYVPVDGLQYIPWHLQMCLQ